MASGTETRLTAHRRSTQAAGGKPPSMEPILMQLARPCHWIPQRLLLSREGKGPKMRSNLLQRMCAEINQRARTHQEFLDVLLSHSSHLITENGWTEEETWVADKDFIPLLRYDGRWTNHKSTLSSAVNLQFSINLGWKAHPVPTKSNLVWWFRPGSQSHDVAIDCLLL